MDEDSKLRECDNLYALPRTVACALHGCVPCSYKLLVKAPVCLNGIRLWPPCRRNQRPEACPRKSGEQVSKGDSGTRHFENFDSFYKPGQKILVLGDGDFSFSRSLAKILSTDASSLTCTSVQSLDEIKEIYTNGCSNIEAVVASGATVHHEVDATKLASYSWTSKYDRIVFNFPCVQVAKGQDGQTEEIEANKALIKDVVASALPLLNTTDGQLHITHKTIAPFSWWNIPQAQGYRYSVVFDVCEYETYTPRKVNDNKSFPVSDAVTHVFSNSELRMCTVDESDGPLSIALCNENKDSLVKLTSERLSQVAYLLQLKPKKKKHFSKPKVEKVIRKGREKKKRRKK